MCVCLLACARDKDCAGEDSLHLDQCSLPPPTNVSGDGPPALLPQGVTSELHT